MNGGETGRLGLALQVMVPLGSAFLGGYFTYKGMACYKRDRRKQLQQELRMKQEEEEEAAHRNKNDVGEKREEETTGRSQGQERLLAWMDQHVPEQAALLRKRLDEERSNT
ncbi:hypothetical protein QOT17_014092 [Balamuthia mandrillaris]